MGEDCALTLNINVNYCKSETALQFVHASAILKLKQQMV